MTRFITGMFLFSMLWPLVVSAQEAKPVRLVVLVDTHRSARTYQLPSAVAEFLSEFGAEYQDFVGAWEISPGDRRVAEFTDFSSRADRNRFVRAVRQLRSRRRQVRDLTASVGIAVEWLAAYQGGVRYVVILTSSGNEGDAEKLATDVRAALNTHSIAVHGIAVGADADVTVLQELAQATSGQVYAANSPAEVRQALERVSVNIERGRLGESAIPEALTTGSGSGESSSDDGSGDGGDGEDSDDGSGDGGDGEDSDDGSGDGEDSDDGSGDGGDGEDSDDGSGDGGDGEDSDDGSGDGEDSDDGSGDGEDSDDGSGDDGDGEDSDDGSGDDGDGEDSDDGSGDGDEEDDENSGDEDDEDAKSESTSSAKGTPAWVWWVAGIGGGLLCLLIIILIIVKVRRSSRRAAEEGGSDDLMGPPADVWGAPSAAPEVANAQFTALTAEGESFAFQSGGAALRVGRKAGNDVVVANRGCSGFHAELCWTDGQLMVVDQGSTNGTFINDERVGTSAIQSGDIIRFDAVAFRVQGHTRAATGAEVNQGGGSGGAGGSDRTMVLDTEDPRLSGLDLGRREPPPEEPEEEPIVLEHRFCVRHKSRISEQLCDGCTLPYCSDCLVDVMGEKLCSKCRTN